MNSRRTIAAIASWSAGLLAAAPVHAAGDPTTGIGGAAFEPLAGGRLVQMLLSLLLVLAIIVAAAWLTRRLGHMRPAGQARFQVLASTSLGPRERVVLLQVGDRQVLLGISGGRMHDLQPLAEPIDLQCGATAGQPQPPAPFAELLGRAMGSRSGGARPS